MNGVSKSAAIGQRLGLLRRIGNRMQRRAQGEGRLAAARVQIDHHARMRENALFTKCAMRYDSVPRGVPGERAIHVDAGLPATRGCAPRTRSRSAAASE